MAKGALNASIPDTLIMVKRNANNALKIKCFHYNHKNVNIALWKSLTLMDSFVIHVQIIVIGTFHLLHAKIALKMNNSPIYFLSAFV